MKTTYFIPEQLNLSELLKENGLPEFDKPIIHDKFYYIIDSLYLRYLLIYYHAWNEYLPVHTGILKSILTHRFSTKIKDSLVKIGVLEKKNAKYRRGEYSYEYRFTSKYREKVFVKVMPNDPKLMEKINRVHSELNNEITSGRLEWNLIDKSIRQLSFDDELARTMVLANEYETEMRRERRLRLIERFKEKEISFRPDAYGRVHHFFTQCSRDLRPFFSWKGKPLFQVDVSCCQPAIAATFYPKWSDEKTKYVDLVETNELYSKLNEWTGGLYDFDNAELKTAFKKMAFNSIYYSSIYGMHEENMESELQQVFAYEFPELDAILKVKKHRHQKYLAHEIQRIESSIMIDSVAREFALAHHNEDICLITIHDSLVSTEEHMPELERRLNLAMYNRLRFQPKSKPSKITGNWESAELNAAAKAVTAEFCIQAAQPAEEVIEYHP